MTPDHRSLAQEDLVRALTGQENPSLEFDPVRLALAGKMLVEKRGSRRRPHMAEAGGVAGLQIRRGIRVVFRNASHFRSC